MKLPLRRKKRPSPIAKILRIWFWARIALRALRFVRRARTAIKIAVYAGAVAGVAAIVRKARGRRQEPVPTYAPTPTPTGTPPAAPPVDAPGAGTREAGLDTSSGTQTGQRLEAEKAASGNGAPEAEADVEDKTPPHGDAVADQEPPTRT